MAVGSTSPTPSLNFMRLLHFSPFDIGLDSGFPRTEPICPLDAEWSRSGKGS